MGGISRRRWRGRGLGLRVSLEAGLEFGFYFWSWCNRVRDGLSETYTLDLVMLS